jgi:AcrR family transcriptional regulator
MALMAASLDSAPGNAGRTSLQASRGRERLFAAMIQVIGERGSEATTVDDVIACAAVSRRTFYGEFSNKRECLLATADRVVEITMSQVREAYENTPSWPERVEAALMALFRLANENPGAVRLSLVEVGSAGPEGFQRRERWLAEFESFIADAVERAPTPSPVAVPVLEAMVGGVCAVLCRRMIAKRRVRLSPLVSHLVEWITSYHPTPTEIVEHPTVPRAAESELSGGRAPGTLARHTQLVSRRGLPRGENNVSRSFVVHNQRERIFDAVINIVAANGYADLKVDDIAKHAAISHSAFYDSFEGKEEALLVAYEVGHAKCLAAVEAAYTAHADWREGARAGIRELLGFLSSEPSFARVALVDILTASPRTLERSTAAVSSFAQMLLPGLAATATGARPPVLLDAVAGGVFELCLRYALQGRLDALPELEPVATYFVLAPFIGGQAAADYATYSQEQS